MSEPVRQARPGRGARRPSPASFGVVRVDAHFVQEYPEADVTSTEAYATLCRTGDALLAEISRQVSATFGIPHAAATALAVIEGAAVPLTPSQVSERILTASATMTATLDLLERHNWIRRIPNPDDRRSVLLQVTGAGRAVTDQLLPGIRSIERSVMSALSEDERTQLLGLLTKVLQRAAEVADTDPEPLHGKRIRPAKLASR